MPSLISQSGLKRRGRRWYGSRHLLNICLKTQLLHSAGWAAQRETKREREKEKGGETRNGKETHVAQPVSSFSSNLQIIPQSIWLLESTGPSSGLLVIMARWLKPQPKWSVCWTHRILVTLDIPNIESVSNTPVVSLPSANPPLPYPERHRARPQV